MVKHRERSNVSPKTAKISIGVIRYVNGRHRQSLRNHQTRTATTICRPHRSYSSKKATTQNFWRSSAFKVCIVRIEWRQIYARNDTVRTELTSLNQTTFENQWGTCRRFVRAFLQIFQHRKACDSPNRLCPLNHVQLKPLSLIMRTSLRKQLFAESQFYRH